MLGEEGAADNIPNSALEKCYSYPDGWIFRLAEEYQKDMAEKNTVVTHVYTYSLYHKEPTRYRLSLDNNGRIVREKLEAEETSSQGLGVSSIQIGWLVGLISALLVALIVSVIVIRRWRR